MTNDDDLKKLKFTKDGIFNKNIIDYVSVELKKQDSQTFLMNLKMNTIYRLGNDTFPKSV